MGPLDPSRLGAFLMRQIPPSDGEVVERGNVLPLGTYRTPDGKETTTFAFPQPMREGLDALAYALGYRQDPNAPAGYVTHDALNKGGQGLAESAMVGSIAAPKPANALAMGIKAYHGSPHRFDKFSMDKIGTGEGAQVYGHGLYFAENPKVAKSYQDTLSGARHDQTPIAIVDGKLFVAGNESINQIVSSSLGNKELKAKLEKYVSDNAGNPYSSSDDAVSLIKAIDEGRYSSGTAGAFYKVDIDADPNQFLDWDKPLSEQPPSVRDAVNRVARDPELGLPSGTVADDARGIQLAEILKNPQAVAKLRELGVSGTRYLDQGSRGAGEGSRNYVVFDDQLITIEDILAANPMAGAVPLAFPAPQEDRNQALARFLASGGA